MKCAVHPDVDASGYCGQCGKALCPECTRDVGGALYCEPCLAGMVGSQQAAAKPAASPTHPGICARARLYPGWLGAVATYLGEYR